MITNNMTREQIEFVGSNHAGVVRQGPDYWIVRVLGNSLMKVPMEDESVVPGLKLHGFWEAWITSWFTKHAPRGGHLIDIGANVGYFSVLACELGMRATAYEPNPDLCKMMSHTAVMNDYSLDTRQWAVSDQFSMDAKLYFAGNLLGSASTTADFGGKSLKVWETPLDDTEFGRVIRCDLIKMDIEGGEEKAWDGMQKVLEKWSPTVVLEYTSGRYSADFPQKLHEYGDLYVINTQGEEEKISRDTLETFPEFEMVVVRP